MSLVSMLQSVLVLSGALFFLIGTVGLLRLPDALARLHALTKVDNLGLGLIIFGLMPSAGSVAVALKLLLIWALVLAASATAAHLIANAKYVRQRENADGASSTPQLDPARDAMPGRGNKHAAP